MQATLADTAAGNREFALVTFFFTVTHGTLPKEIALRARTRALERSGAACTGVSTKQHFHFLIVRIKPIA